MSVFQVQRLFSPGRVSVFPWRLETLHCRVYCTCTADDICTSTVFWSCQIKTICFSLAIGSRAFCTVTDRAKDKKDWTAAEWSKVMFSDESKFCISFGNQGPRVWRKRGEAQNPRRLRSSVKFPQSVMVWGAMSSAGVGPLCFLRSKVNTAVYKEVLEHFMLPAADQLYGDADFIFQQDLAPAHSAKATSTWFKDHGIPVLNWPANSPDLNPIESLWGIVKRKMRYARPNNAEELKATIRATWALITPEQCHRRIDSMPRRIAAVIQAKGAPTKYWVLYMLILFMFILFSWPRFLKILSLYWS